MDNSWIRYFDRSYQQIKARVLTDLALLVPEITDHTESNPWVKMISIFSGLIEMLGYYVDNAAREAHLGTCRLYWTAIKIARAYDYRVHANVAATVDLTFILNNTTPSAITIPAGTLVTDTDGVVKFYTTETVVMPIGTEEITVGAVQKETVTGYSVGTSSGAASQVFELPLDMVDSSCQVSVGATVWTPYFTLGYSISTSEFYVQSVNENKVPYLIFGDGINGKIPTGGSAITMSYSKTLGALGNVGAQVLDTIVSSLTLPAGISIRVENRAKAANGQGVETLEQLKQRIPISLRTLRRAVTKKDYKDIAEMFTGVAKAGVDYGCGKFVNIYIAPVGGGLASSILLSDVFDWFEDKKMITTKITTYAAGEVPLVLVVTVTVKSGYNRAATMALVISNLETFGASSNQEIKGIVYLSDLYQVIENTDGVENSDIAVMKAKPYARALGATTNVLNWTRDIKSDSSSSIRWSITMTSSSTFDLIRDSTFIGNYSTGVLLTFTELTFTVIAGSYSTGDNWEFWTYNYFGTLRLEEPSIPVIDSGDITINAVGGV